MADLYFPPLEHLDSYAADFEADFVCSRCRVFGENIHCEGCGDLCERCHATLCINIPPPTCSLCRKRRDGAWTCGECPNHVCYHCAPEDLKPAGFYDAITCSACRRRRRARDEMEALRPVIEMLPSDLQPAVTSAVQ